MGLGDLLDACSRPVSALVLIGDFFDLSPKALGPVLPRRCQTTLVRVLAPFERNPARDRQTTWLDPESKEETKVDSDGRDSVWRYLQALAAEEERWMRWCGQHRVQFLQHEAGQPFEDPIGEWGF